MRFNEYLFGVKRKKYWAQPLHDPSITSAAYSVSDDGVVVGEYTDESYESNGVGVSLAGYWANHKWDRMEFC